jgi:hypothetical protein
MEDKQQEQQDAAAVQPILVESPLTKETRTNTNKNRRVLPTQRNRSSPVPRKRSASVVSFVDSVSVSTMPPKKKTKTTTAAATTKTRTNWTKQEDVFLCIAFVNVSEDPVVGTGQKSKEFWSRVNKMFKELVKKRSSELEEWVRNTNREETSMQNRFKKLIAKNVLLFNPYYSKVKKAKPSGMQEDDIRAEAAEQYLDFYNEQFKFMHCLDELWKLPKFDPMQEVIEIGSDDEDDAGAAKSTTTTIKSEGGINNTLSVMGGSMARPMGTKAAKQQLKEERSLATIESSLRNETMTSFAASQKSMATSHDLMATSQQKMTDFIGQKLDLQRLGELREMHAFYKGVGEDEAAANIMVEMKQILDYQKQRAEEARLEHAKRKEEEKRMEEEKKAAEENKKTDDGITSVIEVKGRSSSSPTAESELTMNDNNNGDVVDLMDVDTPSKNRPVVDL